MKIIFAILLATILFSCQPDINEDYKAELYKSEYFHRSVKKLTDIMVYDIFSPVVASRIYVYPAIAAYEIMAQAYPEYRPLAGQLTGLKPIPQIDSTSRVDPYLAAIEAYTIFGQQLIFSEDRMNNFRDDLHTELKNAGVPDRVMKESEFYAREVVKHFSKWIGDDLYKQTRTMPKFTITSEPGRWEPTPPSYIPGIEPHWDKIRTLALDSSDQFIPAPPPPFDTLPGSAFFTKAKEVYDSATLQNEEYIAIASFWDCNPFVVHHKGHVMFGTKKISPGGHWIGITALASKKEDLPPMEAINAYTWVSIGLFDGFISCWDEKYRSNLIRPETYINRYIDPLWRPLLQTPPFPEHTSGHSVISRTAAVILTALFGDNFAFDDTVEKEYGLPVRHFPSFLYASEEAAISRLYGGIHYMPAITEGVKQGEKIAHFILKNMTTKTGTMAVVQ